MRISDWISDVCSSDLQPQDPDAALPQDDAADAIVVTGLRASLASAQAIKRNSGQFVDSVTAIDIGKLTDKNVAGALQRISGIQITLNRGEGSSIAIKSEARRVGEKCGSPFKTRRQPFP